MADRNRDPQPTIFDTSEAWRRLQTPIDDGVPLERSVQRVKHDVTNVFQSVLGSIARIEPMVIDTQEAHEALMERIFNVDKGVVIRQRKYTDDKVKEVSDRISGLYRRAAGVLISLTTATVLLSIDIVRKG